MNETPDYYVEALGEANESISRFLGPRSAECEHGSQRCTDGKDHQLWKCSDELLNHLRANRSKLRGSLIFFEKTSAGFEPVVIPEAAGAVPATIRENPAVLLRRKKRREAELLGQV